MLNDLIKDRIKKLEKYRESKNPYPARVSREFSIKEVLEKHSELEKSEDSISIAGRVMAWRDMGKIIFADINDGTGRIQLVLKEEEVKDLELLQETVDMGDIIESSGTAFTTKKNEKSILSNSIDIITKSLRPIPSGFYGLEDKEIRLRKRYLDLVLNEDVKDIFVKKNIFW
ncbi:MAG: OB-fold nucleic acid binding domain-containing protein, partial [Candidatus Paceibacterota bacterium]